MADITLTGYGPHTLAASNDYLCACLGGGAKRTKRLTVAVNRTAGSLSFLSKGENAAAAVALEAQSYTDAALANAATAISADKTVSIDATGRQIVIRTDASFAGDVRFELQRDQ